MGVYFAYRRANVFGSFFVSDGANWRTADQLRLYFRLSIYSRSIFEQRCRRRFHFGNVHSTESAFGWNLLRRPDGKVLWCGWLAGLLGWCLYGLGRS